ncbi:MAG: aminopeptidase N [Frankiaceae bacterium]|jgi:aminopeptidase N|nr:aminopeptidase N [Frankiaceae bacterium]
MVAVPNLTQADARRRAALLRLESYDVELDLTDAAGAPSERTFRSRTTATFSCTEPGASTFIDLIAEGFFAATLNGAELDVSDYSTDGGLALPDLAAENVLVIDAACLYTNTGEGLHRFVDPVDGEVYLYSQFETADAKRMFACFDQPDLKATFALRVTAPGHWKVVSNGALESVIDTDTSARISTFARTPRLSTYLAALIAGPYHEVRDHHDGIDLGIYCRTTLAAHLDADELFAITKQGFDWYHENFQVRYAFGKYDQLFVPEFNAGAMENAGCVTFREDYVFRSKVTDARYERRAETILHEMAHMWFGDLVTMRWWDDLWLNESFATYAAVLCQTAATQWTGAWTTFANVEKTWAYRQDQLPSTHPVATDAPDVQTAEVNFDGITYAKGASVLKQLGAYVGLPAFLAGVRDYFIEHQYGNTTLSDLLSALSRSSGRPLAQWSKLWLETAGINTITPQFELAPDGTYASFALLQTAPTEVAASNVLRPHRLAIGLYDYVRDGSAEDGSLARVQRIELDMHGERTEVPELVGVARPALLLVNDDDLTYCKLRLDPLSLATATADLGKVAESLPRALIWAAAWDMTRDAQLPTRDYLALVLRSIDAETDIGLVQSIQRQVRRALEIYADPAWAPSGWRAWADKALDALRAAEPGSDHQLAWAHAFLGAAIEPEHLGLAERLLSGQERIEGLSLDPDLRWAFVQTLAAAGAISDDAIEAEETADGTAAGLRAAATARALRPSAEAKADAWERATMDDSVPNAMQEALIAGFSHPTQGALLEPYVRRYFEAVPEVWRRRTSELAQNVVVGLFPTWSSTINQDTLDACDGLLAGDLPAPLRRLVTEGRSDVVRALAARAADAAAG